MAGAECDSNRATYVYCMNSETGATARGLGPLAGRRVDEYASIGIVNCDPATPLREVAALMARHRVHAIVVGEEGAPQAPVISDGDLIAAAESGTFDSLRAADIAVTEPVRVRSDEELERAAQLLREHGVTHLIVREPGDGPIGVLSTLDVARAISQAP